MKIQGGLGNQMFQWACIKKLSLDRDQKPIIDLSSYYFDKIRQFQLLGFAQIKHQIDSGQSLILNNSTGQRLVRIVDDFRTFEFPDERLYLDGYWQSQKFFDGIHEQLRNDFNLENYSFVEQDYNQINDSISLHVRRTDYITSGGYHPVQALSYYENALSEIPSDWKKIFVFSDDIEWCKNNIPFDNCVFVEGINEFTTLYLMSKVKHNIIANSSFSWWGAWLNQNSKRKVICPKNWFGQTSGLNWTNIVPNDWTII